LGVPTVADRVAQMVVKHVIEPDLDPVFLPDSYGYRPPRSASSSHNRRAISTTVLQLTLFREPKSPSEPPECISRFSRNKPGFSES